MLRWQSNFFKVVLVCTTFFLLCMMSYADGCYDIVDYYQFENNEIGYENVNLLDLYDLEAGASGSHVFYENECFFLNDVGNARQNEKYGGKIVRDNGLLYVFVFKGPYYQVGEPTRYDYRVYQYYEGCTCSEVIGGNNILGGDGDDEDDDEDDDGCPDYLEFAGLEYNYGWSNSIIVTDDLTGEIVYRQIDIYRVDENGVRLDLSEYKTYELGSLDGLLDDDGNLVDGYTSSIIVQPKNAPIHTNFSAGSSGGAGELSQDELDEMKQGYLAKKIGQNVSGTSPSYTPEDTSYNSSNTDTATGLDITGLSSSIVENNNNNTLALLGGLSDIKESIDSLNGHSLVSGVVNGSGSSKKLEELSNDADEEWRDQEQAMDQVVDNQSYDGDLSSEVPEKNLISDVLDEVLNNNPIDDVLDGYHINTSNPVCSVSCVVLGNKEITFSLCKWQDILDDFGSLVLAMTILSSFVMVVRG